MSEEIKSNDDEILGMARCTNCQKRFLVPKKHENLIGKAIRCPVCRNSFVVSIEQPSPIEQAAIQNTKASEEAKGVEEAKKKSRSRRSKLQIREEYTTKIRDSMGTLSRRLAAIYDQSGSEEQIRIWCVDVLKDALGYDSSNIDTEVYALNQRIDIALCLDGNIFLVIECKNSRSRLNESVQNQAVMYAANKSAEWAVATNGAVWKLWRVKPRKGQDPEVIQVFQIELLDEDGLSDNDVSNFYLLTKRALFNGETLCEFHRQESVNDERLLRAIQSPRVISAMTRALAESYLQECEESVKLTDEFVAARLETLLVPDEL